MPPRKTAILISGRGSNLKALITAGEQPGVHFEIALVISNRPSAGGLKIAEARGIPTRAIDHKAYDHREAFDKALDQELTKAGIELVCLAGFMRILTPWFVKRWQDRLLNIRPSLLPAFKGLDTHARALKAGVRVHGCSVHLVRPDLDDGPIIVQGVVPVLAGDDEDSLAARLLKVEHQAYPHALELVASGNARLIDGKITIDQDSEPPIPWIYPG